MKRLAFLLIPLLALAACAGGLPHAGQVSAKGTTIGLAAGTDPAAGGFSATIGYKAGNFSYNPNTSGKGDGADNAEQILSAVYGGSRDARAMIQWDKVGATAGNGSGVNLALGSGVANGPASVLIACGLAAGAGASFNCADLFAGTPPAN